MSGGTVMLDRNKVRKNRAIYFTSYAILFSIACFFGVIPVIGVLFLMSYLGIAISSKIDFEHEIPALFVGSTLWGILYFFFNHGGLEGIHVVEGVSHPFSGGTEAGLKTMESVLLHHTGKIAEILFFLTGAMTIVEIVDLHKGFNLVKDWISTKEKKKLLWITGIIAFILSAVIDNLTATIVIATVLKKLIPNRELRIWFLGMAVIAANAGGAWSPVGDLTTTMLWIGKKVSTGGLVAEVLIPSIFCFAVPYFIASFKKVFNGRLENNSNENEYEIERLLSSKKMLIIGLGSIVLVPILKSILHIAPFLPMMFALTITWIASTLFHPEEEFTEASKERYSTQKALSRVHWGSFLFFLGILFAVAALETLAVGHVNSLRYIADMLQQVIPNQNIVIALLGIGSAIIDNVPLVAAGMGMFDGKMDSSTWTYLAYAAGTGGSMLIIGSAAGVAAMGQDKIDFIWYMKKIGWLAFIGFAVGSIVFFAIQPFVGIH